MSVFHSSDCRRCLVAIVACCTVVSLAAARPLALVHGTVIDPTNVAGDVPDAMVIVREGRIVHVGAHAPGAVPADARVIDCSGCFLVPGLIDGFSALNNQGQANAMLACGVTTIMGVESTRRGPLILDAHPSPLVKIIGEAGYEPAPLDTLLAEVQAESERGVAVILLMYGIEPDQLPVLASRAHDQGMATIGELGRTSYRSALTAGVDAFVHSSRYNLDLASEDLRSGVAAQPFSDDLDSPKWRYYAALTGIAADRPRVEAYSRELATAQVGLMPTFSLLHLARSDHANPWDDPAAAILDPADIHWPADRVTGEHHTDPAHREAYRRLADAVWDLERSHVAAGALYLAGSAADVWGTLPGVSLHHELAALHEVGLDPRATLAAATSNFRRAFGWADVGLISVGGRADILVLGSDPREDPARLRDIERVCLAGEMLDPADLLQPGIGDR